MNLNRTNIANPEAVSKHKNDIPKSKPEDLITYDQLSSLSKMTLNDRQKTLREQVTTNTYNDTKRFVSSPEMYDIDSPKLKDEIIQMIIQYLHDEGYQASKMTVHDEAIVKWYEREELHEEAQKAKKAILEGAWQDLEKIQLKPLVKNHNIFLYEVYKQQYLEYIENHDIQKALNFLNKKLKPLEHLQKTPDEFCNLCYLLTAKSVHDSPAFKSWEGIGPSREKLAEQFQSMVYYAVSDKENPNENHLPPNRLLTLIKQALAYQVESSRYHPKVKPKITTLFEDYTSFIIPNTYKKTFIGHERNIKCVAFAGKKGTKIISGSSDNTCRVWNTETAQCLGVLEGHTSRVWDISSNQSGTLLASASADGTTKLWDLDKMICTATLTENGNDIYSVNFHSSENYVVNAGYDKTIQLYDISTGQLIKKFIGHQLSVSQAIFNPLGNLIISGSKDNTIKFWDVSSGLCIKTISSYLGEISSVDVSSDGKYMISCSKDNSNRLWDVRMIRPVRRFRGHQNTSKNFIRASFLNDSLIVGGSEDGVIYIWDTDTGDLIQKLRGHSETVYCSVWNSNQSMLCSCSDDNTLKTWWYDENKPLYDEAIPIK